MYSTRRSYTIEEATRTLEGYCSYQERCHQEVAGKLRSMRMIPQAIDQIIVHLIEHDYLDETRFSTEFARGKFRIKKWGKNRIKNELHKREISRYNIKKAISELDQQEYVHTFHQLAEKKWASLQTVKNTNLKKRKLADFLLYRGWESALVYDKIYELARSRV